MRNFFRNILLNILSIIASPSKYVHILNGHFIEEIETEFSQQYFENFIKELVYHFQVISLDEAVSLIKNESNIDRPKIALTFDDGFLECHTKMLPILEKYHCKAAFFINPSSIENQDPEFAASFIQNNLKVNLSKRFLNWDMVKELQSLGHIIGSHTANHTSLKELSVSELRLEIETAKLKIEKETGVVCKYFAFPFGNDNYFDADAIKLVNQTYQFAFTSGLYNKYYHKGNKQIFSRRHFECNWPSNHIKYFTSIKRG